MTSKNMMTRSTRDRDGRQIRRVHQQDGGWVRDGHLHTVTTTFFSSLAVETVSDTVSVPRPISDVSYPCCSRYSRNYR